MLCQIADTSTRSWHKKYGTVGACGIQDGEMPCQFKKMVCRGNLLTQPTDTRNSKLTRQLTQQKNISLTSLRGKVVSLSIL